ncbi:MAG: hypothetical protein LBE80_05920 [Deltaproteobacteria bacterium]|jgi:hypothetical protein|nr:hypothetical protein [Deltaproteobacteria bacterium]
MGFTPFKITKVENHSIEELISRLRGLVMLKDRLVKPYAKTSFVVGPLPYENFRPAQRYVLTNNLLRVQCLEWALAEFGFHPLSLDGYLTIQTDQSPEPIDLLPPIVETIIEADGQAINVVNDGMHRLYAGRLEWRIPTVVLVKDLPAELPYYAYPIPGAAPWDQVTILEGDTIPAGHIKKWHRIADNKKLYRDFNSQFQNVGGPRGQG